MLLLDPRPQALTLQAWPFVYGSGDVHAVLVESSRIPDKFVGLG